MKTAKEIAIEIFYSPATNGMAEQSIVNGEKMIQEYADKSKPKWIDVKEKLNIEAHKANEHQIFHLHRNEKEASEYYKGRMYAFMDAIQLLNPFPNELNK